MSILKKKRRVNTYGSRHNSKLPNNIELRSICVVANPCVYFLKWNGEIVYIGSAMLLHARIGEHMRRRKFEFDAVDYIEFPTLEQALAAEGYYVNHHRPKNNIRIPWSSWEPSHGLG